MRHVAKVHLEKAVPERAGEDLATAVETWRVLSGEEHEVGMGTDHLAGFGDDEFAVVVEKSVEVNIMLMM